MPSSKAAKPRVRGICLATETLGAALAVLTRRTRSSTLRAALRRRKIKEAGSTTGPATPQSDDVLADDISEVLQGHAGLTAAEIAAALSLAQPDPQRRQDFRAITLALFSERERFRCDRSLPERWSLAANSKAAVEAASQVTSGRAAAFDRSRLYAWQRDALVCWEAARHCGVVEAVTGSGKTMLGVAAAADE